MPKKSTQWVNVVDKLPSVDGEYLVHDTRSGYTSVLTYSSQYHLFNTVTGITETLEHAVNVTHWMSLPNPPKEPAETAK